MSELAVHKPLDIVMVRHGESEGNVINHRVKNGEELDVPGYRDRHESLLRLSPRGIEQARIAGGWVLNNVLEMADYPFRFMVSPYNRTMETAVQMNASPVWEPRVEIREREWAHMAYLSPVERRQLYEADERLREMSYYFWTPPGGESIARMIDSRARAMIDTIYRENAGQGVIMVTHGEFMWGVRALMEKLHPLEFNEQDKDRAYHIPNCMVIQYSRRHPETGEEGEHFTWRRAVCPWDNGESWLEGQWVNVPAGRRKVSSEQMSEWYEQTTPLQIPE